MSSRVDIEDSDQRQFWAEGRSEGRSEGRTDRLELAREAGWGRVSWWSVAAGVLTVIGVVAVCTGVVAAVLHAVDLTTDTLSDSEWTRVGFVVGVVSAVAFFGCFALGGYTAGRMARRAGMRHGLLVFIIGVVVIAGAIGIGQLEGAVSVVRDRFDDLGVPTGESTWTGIVLLTMGVALVGALAGSVLGGRRGERWHQRLVARAQDPGIGPEADLRAEVETQRQAATKALERARKAGVVSADEDEESVTVKPDEPTGTPADEADDGDDRDDSREAEPASTSAGPSTPPSS
ncbi:MAG TPA: TIGR04086 family membrane protein [Acidimicrobiia bacterium]|nr:TIGR04086 family membrane protein [Acidimicrobiia bacterium]